MHAVHNPTKPEPLQYFGHPFMCVCLLRSTKENSRHRFSGSVVEIITTITMAVYASGGWWPVEPFWTRVLRAAKAFSSKKSKLPRTSENGAPELSKKPSYRLSRNFSATAQLQALPVFFRDSYVDHTQVPLTLRTPEN